MAEKVEGIRQADHERGMAPVCSFSSRANDASKFKGRFLESRLLSANPIKPLTENELTFLMRFVYAREAALAVDIVRPREGVRR